MSSYNATILREHLADLKGWIAHWKEDVACNLVPTKTSLMFAEIHISHALTVLDRMEAEQNECPACKRERQNAINARRDLSAHAKARYAQPEVKAAYRAYHERKKADPEYRLKRSARRKVSTEIEAGRLKRNPCEICGSPKTDAHHNDYHRPLEVRWLCRLHHFQEEHRANTPPV
ncbi:MAG: hypothetical protein E5X65_33900 [Mesorhizobium sp.]|nr:MAG: hypothetical protein E5X65_33900 [Mesorhizobium sp.]